MLAKRGIQSAFRIIPVHPAGRHLLSMRSRGEVYVAHRAAAWVAFGTGDLLRSSRRATVDQPQDRAHQLQAALRACEELGVPVARGKIGGPGTTLVFWKIELDTVAGVMRLPQAKLQRQHRGLRFRSHRRSSGRWFLQRRCGARAGRAHRSCLSATARWSWRRCGHGQAGTRHLCLSCVRCSFFAAQFVFAWRERHIPGEQKTLADGLSRNVPPAALRASFSSACHQSDAHLGGATGPSGATGIALERAAVEGALSRYTAQGVADSTRRSYAAGLRRFKRFCEQLGLQGLPASERVLSLFCAALAREGLRYATIKSYLAAVCNGQVVAGLGDPFAASMPLLVLMLNGIKREQGRPAADPRLPITPVILRQLRAVWGQTPHRWDSTMLWAVCTVAFFGFLRAGEFTVDSVAAFDPERHLSPADVSTDSLADPSFVKLRIKQSKTDPFRGGVSIVLGRTRADLCPVEALLAYLARRRFAPGPLFLFENGGALSRAALVDQVRRALTTAGVDATRFAGHSFRIGAATTAAARGLDDSTIQTLGRWKSAAFMRYIRLDERQLARYSRALATE